MLGREVQGYLAGDKIILVSPSTVSSTVVPEAVSERFPFLALIYPQIPSVFSTLITPDAIVTVD
jgi:hypothetical protein